MVSFGITVPQRGAFIGLGSMRELLELAPMAEETGLFDSAWVGDSITAKPRPEAIALLGAMAAMTDRLKLGVGCMASFPVRDPIVFAYQWATLDMVSNGRMLLAACTGIVSADGASRKEGSHFGGIVDIDRPARLEEHMELCRRLWTGEEIDFRGRFHDYEGVQVLPRPVQDPCPIWIAANPAPGRYWDRALDRIARLADGFQTTSFFPGMLAKVVDDLRPKLLEQGKDPESFEVMAYHNVNIGSDSASCLEQSQRFLDDYYGPVFSPDMTETWTASGTPDECIADLQRLIDMGATSITLRLTSPDQRGQFRRLVDEVLPAFR